ncbi:MAG: flagellar motor protein MotB [Myxococcales bacterium]|nr:flagellar motor protein MotB [Myxococcales bacterium]
MRNGKKSAVELAQDLLSQAQEVEDPWLLSYADLVTNLLAFMVLLVSMAGISFESIEAFENAFDHAKRAQPTLRSMATEIEALASREGLQGKVTADVDQEGLAIKLEDQILFPSGVATLSPDGQGLVSKVARLIQTMPDKYRFRVEGHTDDVAINTARYRSNWALSADRALEVRQALAAGGVGDDRLSISAYADTRPAEVPEGTSVEERRARSRRVVIRVYY